METTSGALCQHKKRYSCPTRHELLGSHLMLGGSSVSQSIWGFPKITFLGAFGGPHNKDYGILGSMLGSPYFGKLPFRA